MVPLRIVTTLACAALGASCGRESASRIPVDRPEPAVPQPVAAPDPATECAARIQAVSGLPADPALDAYLVGLPSLLVETEIRPVIWARKPSPTSGAEVERVRAELREAALKPRALRAVVSRLASNRPLLRDAMLSEGYFFEPDPAVARAFSSTLGLSDLFEEPEVFVHRDGRARRLSRSGDGYVDEDGNRARLLLNDRLSTAESDLSSPLAFDLQEARRRTGALRVMPIAVGEREAAVEIVLPQGWRTRVLIALEGTSTVVSCVAADPSELVREAGRAARFWSRHERLVEAVERMVAERPGFDEPSDEAEGVQEDGELRGAWVAAYYARKSKFMYRSVEYPVFDRRGRPAPPQVCIDFFFDAWERASGNWYRRRGERPGRTSGFLDISTLLGQGKRHIPSILAAAARDGSRIERFDIPPPDRIPLRDRARFTAAIARNAAEIREGDALVIHGLREEDDEEHYHAVLVVSTDPLSGMPMVVADNAGRPRVRSLVAAMRSAPRRAVKHRLRLSMDWLDELETRFQSQQEM